MSNCRRLSIERLESRALLAVYTVESAGPSNPSDGLTSFFEALNAANATTEPDVIEFAPSLVGSSITLAEPIGATPVAYDLEIRGLGSGQLSFLPSNFGSTGFRLSPNVTRFALSGVTFAPIPTGGFPTRFFSVVTDSRAELSLSDVIATELYDGVIADAGSVHLADTRLISAISAATNSGYGVWSRLAVVVPVTLERSEIRGFIRGGVRTAGDISATDSSVADNRANGGLLSSAGRVDVLRSAITGNTASLNGGGVSAATGATIVDSTIVNNSAARGGGVYTKDGSLSIVGSTIRDNTAGASGGEGGGAYKGGFSTGTVVVSRSTFTGNRTTGGNFANGGGVYSASSIQVADCTFSDNHTTRELSAGGALYTASSRNSSIRNSLFEGNSVAGRDSDGGAVWAGSEITIENCTFRDNWTDGLDGDGGAIHTGGGLIANSTFVGNHTRLGDSDGGAIAHFGGGSDVNQLIIRNATIVNNWTFSASSEGGGLYLFSGASKARVEFSTISGNRVQGTLSRGGGVALGDPAFSQAGSASLELWHTIISDNIALAGNPDLYLRNDNLVSNYSLIEQLAGLSAAQLAAINSGAGNIVNVDPQLGPLASNGGLTQTRAPGPASPVIDAGLPGAAYTTPGIPRYDQRGVPFDRIFGPRVDIGAVEVQPTPANAPSADFNYDLIVDGSDFLIWQRGLGLAPGGAAGGDADRDADIDDRDLAVWTEQAHMPSGVVAVAVEANRGIAAALNAELMDAALAYAAQTAPISRRTPFRPYRRA